MNKMIAKQFAQDLIMTKLASTLTGYLQTNNLELNEKDDIQAQVVMQMNRVAKIMGYDEAWHD